MKSARVVLCFLLAAVAVAVSFSLVNAQGPGPLADPKSSKQAGFPATLYSWVIPPDNQQTPAKIALGKALFFDDRLSADGKVSCDHCHSPAKGFTAYFVELVYDSGTKYPFKFTTEVSVTPDVLPYRWKDAKPITAPPPPAR